MPDNANQPALSVEGVDVNPLFGTPWDTLDCGFCGLTVGLHPRFRNVDRLAEGVAKDPEAHNWLPRSTVVAIEARVRAEALRERDALPALVYLASPYSDPDPSVMEARFEAVCREAALMMAAGEHVYSPIAHTHPIAVRGDLPKDWTFWQDFDRAVIGRCTELRVLRLPGWDASRGVAAEVALAEGMGVAVTYVDVRAAAALPQEG